MNSAETKRNERIACMPDEALLAIVCAEPRAEEISEAEFHSFLDMLGGLRRGEFQGLSKRQRSWAEEAARKVVPLRAEDAPRGKEVATPEVLRNLPKKPPRREP